MPLTHTQAADGNECRMSAADACGPREGRGSPAKEESAEGRQRVVGGKKGCSSGTVSIKSSASSEIPPVRGEKANACRVHRARMGVLLSAERPLFRCRWGNGGIHERHGFLFESNRARGGEAGGGPGPRPGSHGACTGK